MLEQGSPKDICEHYLEAFYEAQQGKGTTTRIKIDPPDHLITATDKDQRQDVLNASNLRNDIQLFEFDSDAPSFGKGGGQIISVRFLDVEGNPLILWGGGEDVVLRIEAVAHSALDSPIIGFFIKDKLGQCLFGDNTWLNYMDDPVACAESQHLVANF
ncbi:MAG: Wzt carbohydrate-binding domain-containing protein, partial [Desulfobulbaceae bacterium]|nr:Wzt carbohydrate-binding domain-containing protein [Desulfobulbaceae bacterium]